MLLLDAGAFLAIERGDRDLMALLKGEARDGRLPVTHGGVVAQVWRGGRDRQVPLARVLAGCHVVALDQSLGRRAGLLLGAAGLSDAVDAALVMLAHDGDTILTSDPGDLTRLADFADVHVDIAQV